MRAELKAKAKEVLSYNRWACIVFTMVPLILACAASALTTSGAEDKAALCSVVSLLCTFFIVTPIAIGCVRGFMRLRAEKTADYNDIVSPFKSDYINAVITMFTTSLFIWLWSLLLIVPGIIKSYKWAMVPYIVAENPQLPDKEIRSISERMMDGHKMELFKLQLSFIGWMLLSCITLGILYIVHVGPWLQLTYLEFFEKVKSGNN